MYEFQLLYCGSIYADEKFHFYGQAPGRMVHAPSYFALIRQEGENILIDSGFDSVDWVREHIGLECKAEKTLEEILGEQGLTPEDIHKVVFTHLHWDHIGSIEKFTKAVFYCQESELRCAIDPPAGMDGYNALLGQKLAALQQRFVTVDGDAELFPGLRVLRLGGHSVGSQAVIVTTRHGDIAMPGDNIARWRNLEENIPAGLLVDLQEARDALETIRSHCDIVLPSHDWKTGEYWESLSRA